MSASESTSRPLLRTMDRRLTDLIEALHPDERRRPGWRSLTEDIRRETGKSISHTTLWALATGQRKNVTVAQLAILAEYFGVPITYFLDDRVADQVNSRLRLATALRDTKVRNLAVRAQGLPDDALDALLKMVNAAREVQRMTPLMEDDERSNTPGT